jgi:hypothetical protein
LIIYPEVFTLFFSDAANIPSYLCADDDDVLGAITFASQFDLCVLENENDDDSTYFQQTTACQEATICAILSVGRDRAGMYMNRVV